MLLEYFLAEFKKSSGIDLRNDKLAVQARRRPSRRPAPPALIQP